MSLYYEAAEILTADSKTGSLKSRIFSKKDLKSQPGQIYALAIETCKWSLVLKEVIENAGLLHLERKITPILSVFLVHDLLLAKGGIALPAAHGLRASVERHKARLQAEFTKARIRRKLGSIDLFKEYIESDMENASGSSESQYPRWVRVNTLKTSLEEQLDTTFAGYEHAASVDDVRQRGSKRIFIDANIPNLVAISPSIELFKTEAYKAGSIIFQDKASCFPAYLLDPLPEDGDIIDSCSAPGNKTTHIASILLSRSPDMEDCSQTIHAFEKNKGRAETLEKMVNLAGSQAWTKLHPGQDFLRTDPESPAYKNVGALLLDPSCSGSGIVGRDDSPELHLPVLKPGGGQLIKHQKKGGKTSEPTKEGRKRKREDVEDLEIMVDDDGEVTAVNSEDELKARLEALSKFQLELLLHAFKFPAARKVTYSTCSVHAQENEIVVQKALQHPAAKEKGWRILSRKEQTRGMREWPVRGDVNACGGDAELVEACIRANKGDKNGTMGFFVAGFVRDAKQQASPDAEFLRDERGHLVRDLMGFPVRIDPGSSNLVGDGGVDKSQNPQETVVEEEEWAGFEEVETGAPEQVVVPKAVVKPSSDHPNTNSKRRPNFGFKQAKSNKKRRGK